MVRQNEPARIANAENVFGWDHTQIENAFSGLDTTDANNMSQNYAKAATEWEQGLETFQRSVVNSIAEAWDGAAAESAKSAIKKYSDDAANLADLMAGMSRDIDAAGSAIVATKNAIPAAAAHSWTANIWPPRAAEEERSRNNVTNDSRTAMLNHYVNQFKGYDQTVPVLPAALNPTQPGGDQQPPQPGGPGGPGSMPAGGHADGGHGAPSSAAGHHDPKTDQPSDGKPGDPSSATKPSAGESPAAQAPMATPGGPDAGSHTAPASSAGTSTTPSGISGGGPEPGGSGGPGSGFGSGSGSGASRGGPGRSVPGPKIPGGAAEPAAALGRGTATGGAGMPGIPGMGAGKSQKESERTHKTADYLINAENAAELIGEEPKTLPGGVIGANPADDRGDAR
ncbi:MAG: WXG100 family type VII secretion target [Nocardia sp.]|nr:WXG100 family type VII secretion target [Nocardia sp.]